MHVDPLPKKHKPISLTPLVDVIFLLLLFFMLSSTFTKFGQVEIGAPPASGGAGAMPKAILTVRPEGLRLNGSPIADEMLEDQAGTLMAKDIDNILVLVRGESTTQQLVTVMSVLRNVEGLTVTVAGGQ
ncbi:biopolymer transporter ExbD [Roseibium denhamense]|uniref:Outer membrane transport energization protein ExbD n=1 Tax=Roseibium denhamense TaxID=76305 RepID=A0ABY1P5P2_9HYPH|nr:biopolymer transporter ExbD [Roseibium denhamense]MTI07151.1 biopolymer transporter ExbD [Roseibium denhamense]SMP26835.1 outer membrane transport energization protein ExbD [Roseibium denhamense]